MCPDEALEAFSRELFVELDELIQERGGVWNGLEQGFGAESLAPDGVGKRAFHVSMRLAVSFSCRHLAGLNSPSKGYLM